MKRPEQMSLVFSIVERGGGGRLVKLYEKNRVFTHVRFEGQGTATSEIMDILGLGSSEKDLILSITTHSAARALLDKLDDELRGKTPGRGIVFTVRLAALSGLLASYINMKTRVETGGKEPVEKQQKNSMILATVNQGYTDVVMETARRAGARGGTVVRGRWAGDSSFAETAGITTLQEEKELLIIVVPTELRNKVMDAIAEDHGLRTEAGAMVAAMGVERLLHL